MAGLNESDQRLFNSATEKRKNTFYNPSPSTTRNGITGKGNSRDSAGRLSMWYNTNKGGEQSTLKTFFDTYGSNGYTKEEIMGLQNIINDRLKDLAIQNGYNGDQYGQIDVDGIVGDQTIAALDLLNSKTDQWKTKYGVDYQVGLRNNKTGNPEDPGEVTSISKPFAVTNSNPVIYKPTFSDYEKMWNNDFKKSGLTQRQFGRGVINQILPDKKNIAGLQNVLNQNTPVSNEITGNWNAKLQNITGNNKLQFKEGSYGDLMSAIGIRGHIGGFDRGRLNSLSSGDYTTRNIDGRTYLKFNKSRFNNNATNQDLGYDITDYLGNRSAPQINQSMVNQVLKNLFKPKHKFGGKMTQKYQQGGAAPQGDPQEQIIQLVQAAMGGDQQASAQIQQIMQAAQQGDQQAAQLAEMIMQIANQMQGGAPEQSEAQIARNGAKLNYIKRLKGECPEGYEMAYFKAGGKVCKKCQKKVEKACSGKQLARCGTKFHKAGGVMESILSEMFAKGGAMNRNKHTAFGEEKGANVVSTNHAGRWGGRRAFNERGTHNLNPHDKPNKFTAFGDEGKKKPTNVGLVGHHATGKTGRMQNRQKAGTTYKGTAFGGEKQNRFHRGAKASSIGRIGSINGYPKGHGGKSGIGKI